MSPPATYRNAVTLIDICPTSTKRLGYRRNDYADSFEAKRNSTSTLQFFEATAETRSRIDSLFFTQENVRSGKTLEWVSSLIEYRRHSKSLANYLYYDGHVQTIPATGIEEWVQRGWNFFDVGAASYSD